MLLEPCMLASHFALSTAMCIYMCRSLQGVKLLFYDSKADILLLDISATIPDRFSPYLLGFDGSNITVPTRAVGIHHPHGNFKHISYANTR